MHVLTPFLFNPPPTTAIYTLSLHDALPISAAGDGRARPGSAPPSLPPRPARIVRRAPPPYGPSWSRWEGRRRSEEHTSELQSPDQLVCRLLLEKKNYI